VQPHGRDAVRVDYLREPSEGRGAASCARLACVVRRRGGEVTAKDLGVEPEIAEVVVGLLSVIVRLVKSEGDAAARLEALEIAAEHVKAALDREKFGEAI